MSEGGIITIVFMAVGGLVGICGMAFSFARWYLEKVRGLSDEEDTVETDVDRLRTEVRELKESITSLTWAVEQQNRPVLADEAAERPLTH